MAPFTVHVNGLGSSLGIGTELTARYEWNFGDAGSPFNSLVGWNAAHTYNQPGSYTITLKLTNQAGQSASVTQQITVNANTRSVIYVSPSGSDSNSGTSSSSPIKTYAKAATMLASNRSILFQRGGVYPTTANLYISQQNLTVGAYGSGALPVIQFTSSASYAKMIDFDSSARDVVIENLRFDSTNAQPNNTIVRALQPHGTNITVRNCSFGKISYAMNTGGGGVNGLLSQSNAADVLGAYYLWGEGSNHVHIGNTVAGGLDEHNIRFGGCSKILLANNDLTNTSKSTIWCMLGDHCYVAGNRLRSGRLIAGPNFAVVNSGDHFDRVVAENNEFFDAGAVVYDGASNIRFRNNVMHADSLEAFSIWGYSPERGRTTSNIAIDNNTVINNNQSFGKFIKVGAGAQAIAVCNNMYVAPWLNGNAGGNVIMGDGNLSGHMFRNNIWSNPVVGSRWYEVGGTLLNAAQWDALAETQNEVHRAFSSSDLDGLFKPMFAASVAAPVGGVFTDFRNGLRPASGAWTAGAVETASGGTTPPPPPPPTNTPGDVNRDGLVNVADMLQVIGAWGTCSGCAADLTGDGIVNVNDLLQVISHWR